MLILDAFSAAHDIPVTEACTKGLCGRGTLGAHELLLCKPLTYMNRSGEAVLAGLQSSGPGCRLMVLHDDLDLEPGRLRVRKGGGHGGHRGIRSIMEYLGHGDFVRVKIGIGRPAGLPVTDYVLDSFGSEEWPLIRNALDRAVQAVETIILDGPEAAMNRFNSPPSLVDE